MMNCCCNFLANSRIHVIVPIGPRLFPSVLFTLYIFVCTNFGLGCILSKHALGIHEIVVPVSNRDIVLFLLIVRGKFTAYFMMLNLTLIISSVCNSHSESDEELKLLSGLWESWWSLVSSGSDFVFLDVHVCPVIPLNWLMVLGVLHVCLSEVSYYKLYWDNYYHY